jgi:aminoglycoside 2''-phosphotransferase
MFTVDDCIHAINTACPALEIHSAEPDTSGQFNFVLLVNNLYIFRFPRYAEGIAVLEREAAILDAVSDHLPLPVPVFTYRNLDTLAPGGAFVGYRRLAGVLLRGETLQDIQSEKTIRRLAVQLAGFMDALHHVPPTAVGVNLPVRSPLDYWRQMYNDIRTLLFPHMRADARQWAIDHFETYLADDTLQQFKPCLIHGDLGPGNVLYDTAAHVLSGVIDFGFSGLGDPAQDIAAASCFGDAFIAAMAENYPQLHTYLPRARFIKGTFALQEALHGVKSGDREAFESGIEQYR